MNSLKDYENQINRCSKCGLCQSVCPVYRVNHNDCAVSRGKFIMLKGLLNNDLKFDKISNRYLDMCLKCNACKDFCPSGINAAEIFETAKCEYFSNLKSSYFAKIFQSKLVFLAFLNFIRISAFLYRSLNLDIFIERFYPILGKFGFLGRKLILANEFVKKSPKFENFCKVNSWKKEIKSLKVVYFSGCVNEFVNPRAKIATENLFKKMGVEVLKTKFECCGMPFFSCGNLKQFIKQAEYNLAQIPDDFDYFITDCASCAGAFRKYEKYITNNDLLEKLKKINEKSLNIVDFVLQNIENSEFKLPVKITFHKPCHLEKYDFVINLLKSTKNIEYIETEDFDTCCGFGGEFILSNSRLSEEISTIKAENILKTDADYVVTTCPACVLGLKQGLINAFYNEDKLTENQTASFKNVVKNLPKVINLVELLSVK